MLGNDMDTNTGHDEKPLFDSYYFEKPVDDKSKCTSSDSQFQSLGMIINNDKLVFKLEDPTKMCSSVVPQTYPSFNTNDTPSLISLSDTSSIMVLGKDSLDLIQSSSLSSYIDIQQKCKSVDYKSIISSLSSTEMQKKLAELLEENLKLKETLKQNNTAMKQQLNTLAMWQGELVKVCQSHKQKFAETKELISYLKNENTALKLELSAAHSDDLTYNKLRPTCTQTASSEEQVSGTWESYEKVHTWKEKQSTVVSNFASFEKLPDQSIESMEEQSTKAKNFEIIDKRDLAESSHVTSSHSKSPESNQKNSEGSNVLKDFIALSEQILQNANMGESSLNTLFYQDYQRFLDNVKQYNRRLQDLEKCFDAQIHRFAAIHNSVEEVSNFMDPVYNTISKRHAFDLHDVYCHSNKRSLSHCIATLLEEQENLTSNKEVFIKVQKEFLQILIDYNKILWKLKTVLEENSKLNEVNNSLTEKISNLEKSNSVDKYSLEEKEDTLREERACFNKEKKLLNDQWASVRLEQQKLSSGKELLENERSLLHKEKMSLDIQCELYEKEQKTLQMEKKILERRHNEITAEMNALRKDLQQRKHDITILEKQLAELNQENNLMKLQLTCYEQDFEQERKRGREIKDTLIEEKNVLYEKLQQQLNLNKKLHEQISSNNSGNSGLTDPNEAQLVSSCPKCNLTFTDFDKLKEHVEEVFANGMDIVRNVRR